MAAQDLPGIGSARRWLIDCDVCGAILKLDLFVGAHVLARFGWRSDVNWVSPEGDTALLAACRNGHVSAALCLLNHGASANQAAKDGQTALHLSCRRGQEAVAEALILGGADVFARDNSGETAVARLRGNNVTRRFSHAPRHKSKQILCMVENKTKYKWVFCRMQPAGGTASSIAFSPSGADECALC